MRWSKLRQLVKDRFAPELAGRLDINSTAYGACTCGHAWLTWDGDVIANFCIRAHGNVGGFLPDFVAGEPEPGKLVGYGEFSRQDAYKACWAFVHDLSIEEALDDEDPLVSMLALADARVGKRRLRKLDGTKFHPVAAKMIELRKAAWAACPTRQNRPRCSR
ncbi:SF0329 family protein [Erythrobacter sp. HA6-11]